MSRTQVKDAWLLYLVLASLPFGPSIANIVAGVCTFYLAAQIYKRRLHLPVLTRNLTWTLYGGLAYILWMGFVTVLNGNSVLVSGSAVIGYLPFVLFPFLWKWVFPDPSLIPWRRLQFWLTILSILWTLLLISQYLFEWRFYGLSIIPNEARPRGFYSHPLSLAYGLLLFWPLSLELLKRDFRNLGAWLLALSLTIGLILTQSRTVQAVAALVLILNLVASSSGRRRWIILGCLLTAGILLSTTQNVVREKFIGTFSQKGLDRFSNYPDDRLAFWHAHALMIQERPVLGHGWGMDDAYRLPYYAKIGLPDFKKPYGAHNVFIQILAEGGFVGLGFFLLWLFSFFHFAWTRLNPFAKAVACQSLLAFFIASLTQNTMQDFSVRVLLGWLCTALLLSSQNHGTARTEEKNPG